METQNIQKFIFKKGEKNWNLVHDLVKLNLNVIANLLHNDLQDKPRFFDMGTSYSMLCD